MLDDEAAAAGSSVDLDAADDGPADAKRSKVAAGEGQAAHVELPSAPAELAAAVGGTGGGGRASMTAVSKVCSKRSACRAST
jgi:hypothetical protein